MIEIKLDLSEFEKYARKMDAASDQVPFALSRSLNQAAINARRVLIEDTWPKHVTVRNPNFISWALRTMFSTKRNLRVEIYDQSPDQRAHLQLHAFGGTKTAKSNRLAIPPKGSVIRGARGVRKSQKPAAIIANTPKRALRITAKGIFVGVKGKLVLKYLFRRSVQQPADVPFEEDFKAAMLEDVRRDFPFAMRQAMSTRR